MIDLIFVALLQAAAGDPAPAAETQEPPAQETTENTAEQPAQPERVVCRRERTTGSRVGGQRVCLTASQEEDRRRDARELLDEVQRRQSSVSPTP